MKNSSPWGKQQRQRIEKCVMNGSCSCQSLMRSVGKAKRISRRIAVWGLLLFRDGFRRCCQTAALGVWGPCACWRTPPALDRPPAGAGEQVENIRIAADEHAAFILAHALQDHFGGLVGVGDEQLKSARACCSLWIVPVMLAFMRLATADDFQACRVDTTGRRRRNVAGPTPGAGLR